MEEKQISEDLVLRLKFCWHAISGVRLGFRTGQRRFFAPAGSVQCLPAKEWYLQALPILLHDRTDSCWKSVLRSEWVPPDAGTNHSGKRESCFRSYPQGKSPYF